MSPTKRIPERSKVIPMHAKVHPTALVAPGAQIGVNVEIGPFSIIGENVKIDDGTIIGPHVVIDGWTTIGKNNRIYTGAVIGNDPQDLKFKGERSYLTIGDDNIIREYATISRGTEGAAARLVSATTTSSCPTSTWRTTSRWAATSSSPTRRASRARGHRGPGDHRRHLRHPPVYQVGPHGDDRRSQHDHQGRSAVRPREREPA